MVGGRVAAHLRSLTGCWFFFCMCRHERVKHVHVPHVLCVHVSSSVFHIIRALPEFSAAPSPSSSCTLGLLRLIISLTTLRFWRSWPLPTRARYVSTHISLVKVFLYVCNVDSAIYHMVAALPLAFIDLGSAMLESASLSLRCPDDSVAGAFLF